MNEFNILMCVLCTFGLVVGTIMLFFSALEFYSTSDYKMMDYIECFLFGVGFGVFLFGVGFGILISCIIMVCGFLTGAQIIILAVFLGLLLSYLICFFPLDFYRHHS